MAITTACTLTACATNAQPTEQTTQTIDPKPIILESKYNFAETVDVLNKTLAGKGMTIFANIDHQAFAKKDGLNMQPATVIVYGTPKAGTPLMVKDASLALQLPLKVLVTEPKAGQVQVMFNTANQLIQHSNTPYSDVQNNLANAEKLIRATVAK